MQFIMLAIFDLTLLVCFIACRHQIGISTSVSEDGGSNRGLLCGFLPLMHFCLKLVSGHLLLLHDHI